MQTFVILIKISERFKLVSVRSDETLLDNIKKLHDLFYPEEDTELEVLKDIGSEVGINAITDENGFLNVISTKEEIIDNLKEFQRVSNFFRVNNVFINNGIIDDDDVLVLTDEIKNKNNNSSNFGGWTDPPVTSATTVDSFMNSECVPFNKGQDYSKKVHDPRKNIKPSLDPFKNKPSKVLAPADSLFSKSNLKVTPLKRRNMYRIYFNKEIGYLVLYNGPFDNNTIASLLPEFKLISVIRFKLDNSQLQKLNDDIADRIFDDINDAKNVINNFVKLLLLSSKNKTGGSNINKEWLLKAVNSLYEIDDNLENRIKFTDVYQMVCRKYLITNNNSKKVNYLLPKVLKDIGLNKKRYSDGVYWYGLKERSFGKVTENQLKKTITEYENETKNIRSMIRSKYERVSVSEALDCGIMKHVIPVNDPESGSEGNELVRDMETCMRKRESDMYQFQPGLFK